VALSPLNTNPPRFGLGLIDSAAGHLVQGSSVTYLASPSVSASGGSEGQVPSFTTTFPAGLTPGSATGTNWSCTTTGQTVTCNYTGTLPISPGTSLPAISLPVTVSNSLSGPVSVTAYVTSDASIAANATDNGTAVATSAATPVLGIGLTDSDAGAYTQGGVFSYTALPVVSSGGTNEADAPTFTDVLPASLIPGSATGTNWSCGTVSQTVTCSYTGALPITAGTFLPALSVPVTASTSASGAVSNTATISSADASPASASATDTGSITTVPQYTLTYTDNVSGNFTSPGTVAYTANPAVSSNGANETSAPTFSVNLPVGSHPERRPAPVGRAPRPGRT